MCLVILWQGLGCVEGNVLYIVYGCVYKIVLIIHGKQLLIVLNFPPNGYRLEVDF